MQNGSLKSAFGGLLLALVACGLVRPSYAEETGVNPPAESPRPAYHLSAEGDLYISADGSVLDYKLQSKNLSPEIAVLVDKKIRGWRFEPIIVDGKPVTAKTRLDLSLNATPVPGGYQLRIAGVGFGNPVRKPLGLKPPTYPIPANRAGVEADVVLLLTLNGNGRVVKSDVERTSLSGKGPQRVVTQWADMFEKSAQDAVRHWRFELTEQVDGKAASKSRVRIPVIYRLDNTKGWRAMVPVVRPGHYLQFEDDKRLANASMAPTDQRPQSLDSDFILRDKVIGTAL